MYTKKRIMLCYIWRLTIFYLINGKQFKELNTEFNESRFSTFNQITEEQFLIKDLTYIYDSASRPVFNASNTITVKISFSLIQIIDVVGNFFILFKNILKQYIYIYILYLSEKTLKDERNQVLTINFWLERVSKQSIIFSKLKPYIFLLMFINLGMVRLINELEP